MNLLKCPKCGEMFADSYKECPFCQEEEAYLSTDKKVKGRGRRVEKPKSPSILGPALIVVVILLAAFLVYTFFGDKIATWFDGTKNPPVEEQVDGPDKPVELTLDKTEMKMTVGDTATLTASVKDGCQWSSSEPAVATVDETGKVSAVKEGTTTISVLTDKASAACVVTVEKKAEPQPEPKPEPEPEDPKPSETKEELKLVADVNPNLPLGEGKYDYDFGMAVGDVFTLDVEGTDSAITWKSSNTDKVTISDDGTIERIDSGEVTITATVDGQTIKALVR